MVLSQISNKFHRFQQITKQGKVNVQRKANRKNDYDILIFLDIYVFLFLYMYYYYYYYLLLSANVQYFLNKICKAYVSTNQVSKF